VRVSAARVRRARALRKRSVFELGLPNATFDLVVCRHLLQAIPHPDRVLAELIRVTRHGGWLHLIAEDYLMIHFEARHLDPDDFWSVGLRRYGQATGTDLRIGRNAFRILRCSGLGDQHRLRCDRYIRVPRPTFAAIWEAWRDGYTDTMRRIHRYRAKKFGDFEDMITTIRDEHGYGVWHVPVIAARIRKVFEGCLFIRNGTLADRAWCGNAMLRWQHE